MAYEEYNKLQSRCAKRFYCTTFNTFIATQVTGMFVWLCPFFYNITVFFSFVLAFTISIPLENNKIIQFLLVSYYNENE